jgi:hypothetical protein
MAKQVFASIDLLRLIYSFGDPSHRKFTHDLKWDLRPWPEVFLSRYTDRRLIEGYQTYSIQDFLYEYSNETIEHMLRTFSRCYCCQRHNINKPTIYQKTVSIPSPSVFETHPEDCLCACRSLSRHCIQSLEWREA